MNIKEETMNQIRIMRRNFTNLRKSKNLTIEDLSEITGINTSILMDIEDGNDFEVEYIFDLLYLYNIKPKDIFSYIYILQNKPL